MKVAVMQPYLFPYLGYFQLVHAADVFVFADDVNFIKRGFINRNKILFQNKEQYFTVPCIKASQNKLINEIQISTQSKGYPENILQTIRQAYIKAPFFNDVFPIIESIFHSGIDNIATLAATSVESVSKYLEINVDFKFSSVSFNHTKGQERSMRLLNITKELGSDSYINPKGGDVLYDKDFFKSHGVNLDFLMAQISPYSQSNNVFVPNLSIIDVIMFNSIEETRVMLNQYSLV
ncbi:WbqC family protein [Arenibacter palladensis]|uniref:WbqC family protein n=1 Tax=Arenibacter palladensis TaxID=237373 RepID=UPI0026E484D6|nr:WbqC family protein [Arenibacter palladensis]MDO6605163.1 WbqC family protein [Arenibacter palladensis]